MKIKTTVSSSGKKNSPKKIDKNQEEKIFPVQVSQTSDVQSEEQETGMPIPQEKESRSESLCSEESTYYSCEDADDFDDDVSLTKEQKYRFFKILRDLLKESGFLSNGKKVKVHHDGKILMLMYMTKNCEITVQDLHEHVLFQEVVSTQDIYLTWRGDNAEYLSLSNLQKVWNELRFLKILNKKIDACFSKAINEFKTEFKSVQENATLKLICDDVILTFVSGKGRNVAAVTYDDGNKKPKYVMEVRWWITFLRFLYRIDCNIWEWNDVLKYAWNTFISLLDCIHDLFCYQQKHQKMQ